MIRSLTPRYAENYGPGYIGFSAVLGNSDFISKGILYFERWECLSDIRVSHALVVTGENECVQALMGKGVCKDSLAPYFENPGKNIFFRKPANYSEKIGKRIADAAKSQVGQPYDDGLIGGFLLRGTLLGHLINNLFGDVPANRVNGLLNKKDRWICSELAAYALNQQPEYAGRGILSRPTNTIDPQQLFEDQVIFEPWHH